MIDKENDANEFCSLIQLGILILKKNEEEIDLLRKKTYNDIRRIYLLSLMNENYSINSLNSMEYCI